MSDLMNAYLTVMCFVLLLLMLLLTIELAALLSPNIFKGSFTFNFRSLNILFKYKAFLTADVKAIVSASVVDRAIVDCLLLFQLIGEPLISVMFPVVYLHCSVSLAKSESEKVSMVKDLHFL